jgi:hypothetical protein
MSTSANSDLAEPKDDPGTRSEIRGDNPGVGGLPARDVDPTPDTEDPDTEDPDTEQDPEDEPARGDNPGVGGVPARDIPPGA